MFKLFFFLREKSENLQHFKLFLEANRHINNNLGSNSAQDYVNDYAILYETQWQKYILILSTICFLNTKKISV